MIQKAYNSRLFVFQKIKNKKNLSQVLDKAEKVGIIERVEKAQVRWSRG